MAITGLSLLAMACIDGRAARDRSASSDSQARIELLVREGCANSAELELRLENALEPSGLGIAVIDQAQLTDDDARRGYATPTVLVDGTDLFGLSRPTRPYPAPT